MCSTTESHNWMLTECMSKKFEPCLMAEPFDLQTLIFARIFGSVSGTLRAIAKGWTDELMDATKCIISLLR